MTIPEGAVSRPHPQPEHDARTHPPHLPRSSRWQWLLAAMAGVGLAACSCGPKPRASRAAAPVPSAPSAPAQPASHVVQVGPDGSFSPGSLRVRSGDTVEWVLSDAADSVVPVAADVGWPASCSAAKPVGADGPNDFLGPMATASGIFSLAPVTRQRSLGVDDAGRCRRPVASGAGGTQLCEGLGTGATMASTWRSASITGVFLRFNWNELNPAPGVYDFALLDRELEQAVASGKSYALSIQAGRRGTPAWIFDNGVTELRLQDGGSHLADDECGAWMRLGSPTDRQYQTHYFAMLSAAATHLRSRGDWYRALAYVKPSGANLYTHENRLPKRCNTAAGCACNTQILAEAGYTPSGLETFYRRQLELLAREFPGKLLVYALIQDGFPKINDRGGYALSDGSSSDGRPLPRVFGQTQSVLDLGQGLLPNRFVVQHNGLRPVPAIDCPNRGQHPVPLRPERWYARAGSGCPNRWVLREGAQGMLTAWQTINARNGVDSPTSLDSALRNGWESSDGFFVEIYEERLWEADHRGGPLDFNGTGRTLEQWKQLYESRRPHATIHRHTFRSVGDGEQIYRYAHGSKCRQAPTHQGTIVVTP